MNSNHIRHQIVIDREAGSLAKELGWSAEDPRLKGVVRRMVALADNNWRTFASEAQKVIDEIKHDKP